jgi:hypothetical protein
MGMSHLRVIKSVSYILIIQHSTLNEAPFQNYGN